MGNRVKAKARRPESNYYEKEPSEEGNQEHDQQNKTEQTQQPEEQTNQEGEQSEKQGGEKEMKVIMQMKSK